VTCPHCGADDLDKGATGLDLCDRCGGLSRDGRALRGRQQRFQTFGRPRMVDLQYVHAQGSVVAAVVVGDGSTGIAVTFVMPDGKQLVPIVLSGDEARTFGRLVADALRAGRRTEN